MVKGLFSAMTTPQETDYENSIGLNAASNFLGNRIPQSYKSLGGTFQRYATAATSDNNDEANNVNNIVGGDLPNLAQIAQFNSQGSRISDLGERLSAGKNSITGKLGETVSGVKNSVANVQNSINNIKGGAKRLHSSLTQQSEVPEAKFYSQGLSKEASNVLGGSIKRLKGQTQSGDAISAKIHNAIFNRIGSRVGLDAQSLSDKDRSYAKGRVLQGQSLSEKFASGDLDHFSASDLRKGVGQIASQKLGAARDNVGRRAQNLKDNLTSQAQDLRETVKNQGLGLRDQVAAQVQGVRDQAGQLKDNLTEQGQNLRQNVTDQVQGVRDQAGQLKDNLTEQGQNLRQNVTDQVQGVRDQAGQLKDNLSEQGQNLRKNATEQAQGLREQAARGAAGLRGTAEGEFNGRSDEFKARVSQARQTGTDRLGTIRDGYGQGRSNIQEPGFLDRIRARYNTALGRNPLPSPIRGRANYGEKTNQSYTGNPISDSDKAGNINFLQKDLYDRAYSKDTTPPVITSQHEPGTPEHTQDILAQYEDHLNDVSRQKARVDLDSRSYQPGDGNRRYLPSTESTEDAYRAHFKAPIEAREKNLQVEGLQAHGRYNPFDVNSPNHPNNDGPGSINHQNATLIAKKFGPPQAAAPADAEPKQAQGEEKAAEEAPDEVAKEPQPEEDRGKGSGIGTGVLGASVVEAKSKEEAPDGFVGDSVIQNDTDAEKNIGAEAFAKRRAAVATSDAPAGGAARVISRKTNVAQAPAERRPLTDEELSKVSSKRTKPAITAPKPTRPQSVRPAPPPPPEAKAAPAPAPAPASAPAPVTLNEDGGSSGSTTQSTTQQASDYGGSGTSNSTAQAAYSSATSQEQAADTAQTQKESSDLKQAGTVESKEENEEEEGDHDGEEENNGEGGSGEGGEGEGEGEKVNDDADGLVGTLGEAGAVAGVADQIGSAIYNAEKSNTRVRSPTMPNSPDADATASLVAGNENLDLANAGGTTLTSSVASI
jgi:hypothetical protein